MRRGWATELACNDWTDRLSQPNPHVPQRYPLLQWPMRFVYQRPHLACTVWFIPQLATHIAVELSDNVSVQQCKLALRLRSHASPTIQLNTSFTLLTRQQRALTARQYIEMSLSTCLTRLLPTRAIQNVWKRHNDNCKPNQHPHRHQHGIPCDAFECQPTQQTANDKEHYG